MPSTLLLELIKKYEGVLKSEELMKTRIDIADVHQLSYSQNINTLRMMTNLVEMKIILQKYLAMIIASKATVRNIRIHTNIRVCICVRIHIGIVFGYRICFRISIRIQICI